MLPCQEKQSTVWGWETHFPSTFLVVLARLLIQVTQTGEQAPAASSLAGDMLSHMTASLRVCIVPWEPPGQRGIGGLGAIQSYRGGAHVPGLGQEVCWATCNLDEGPKGLARVLSVLPPGSR